MTGGDTSEPLTGRGPSGLAGAAAIAAMYAAVALATVVTYHRLPAGGTYHFDDTGAHGAVSRLITYLNYPVAIAAIALAAVAAVALGTRRARIVAAAAIALCLVATLPGVVSEDDLRAAPANIPAVAGVALAGGLLAAALARHGPTAGRGSPAGDRARLAVGAVLVVCSLPWIVAALGWYAGDVPLLGDIFRAEEPTPGEPGLPSVHRGLHEGLFGVQLALTALVVSRSLGAFAGRARVAMAAFLGLMLAYGVGVTLQDGWNEQVVKRGWTDMHTPDVLVPSLGAGWAILLVAAGLVAWGWLRPPRPGRPAERGYVTRAGSAG